MWRRVVQCKFIDVSEERTPQPSGSMSMPSECCCLLDWLIFRSCLKTKPILSSETSANFYQTTRSRIPKERILHSHRRDNLKSNNINAFYKQTNIRLMWKWGSALYRAQKAHKHTESNENGQWNKAPELLVILYLFLRRVSSLRHKKRQKKLFGCEISPSKWWPIYFPFRTQRKLVVVTVGGDFRTGKPSPPHKPPCYLSPRKKRKVKGRTRRKINEYSWNCGVICVTGVRRVFLLATKREAWAHDQRLRVGPQASQKSCLSAGNQESYHRISRGNLVFTTGRTNVELSIRYSTVWLQAEVLHKRSFSSL
jgi:hypothetical protein